MQAAYSQKRHIPSHTVDNKKRPTPESEREDNPFYDGFTNHDIDRKGAMCLLNSEEGAFIFFNASPVSPSMQIERSAISFGA